MSQKGTVVLKYDTRRLRSRGFPAVLALAAALCWLGARPAAAASAACPVSVGGVQPPETQPAPLNDAYWQTRVGQLDATMAHMDLSQVQTLFLGDSITEGWLPLLFDQFYGHRGPAEPGRAQRQHAGAAVADCAPAARPDVAAAAGGAADRHQQPVARRQHGGCRGGGCGGHRPDPHALARHPCPAGRPAAARPEPERSVPRRSARGERPPGPLCRRGR